MLRPILAGLLLPVLGALIGGCGKESPEALVLKARRAHTVSITAMTMEEGGETITLELDVENQGGHPLPQLTVLMEQLDASDAPVGRVRVPLDTGQVRAYSGQILYAEVPALSPEVAGLTVSVEAAPPRAEWKEFPELAPFAGA